MHFHIDKNRQEALQRIVAAVAVAEAASSSSSHCHLVSLSTGIVTMLQLLQMQHATTIGHPTSPLPLSVSFPVLISKPIPIPSPSPSPCFSPTHTTHHPFNWAGFARRLNAHATNSLQMFVALRARKHFLITQMSAAQFALPAGVLLKRYEAQRES